MASRSALASLRPSLARRVPAASRLLPLASSALRADVHLAPTLPRSSPFLGSPSRDFRASSVTFLRGGKEKSRVQWTRKGDVTYEELKPLTMQPSEDIVLIDVREPDEVSAGMIPSAVSVPLSGFEKSLDMDEGDFSRVHGFKKPLLDQKVIMYCRGGVRSQTAIDLAAKRGWKNARNYRGSWLDWVAKEEQHKREGMDDD